MQQNLKSEITKELIVKNAFNLFYENGFKATSVDRIMKKSALSKGAFYHHYDSKKDLGLAVITSKIQERVVKGMIIPLKGPGDAFQILEAVFINRLREFPSYDLTHGCPLNNMINEIGDDETVYQNALRNIIEHWQGELITLIERGKTENSIKPDVSSSAVSTYLISAFEGIRGIRKLYNDDKIVDEFLEGLSIFLNQIKE